MLEIIVLVDLKFMKCDTLHDYYFNYYVIMIEQTKKKELKKQQK